jgi:predicted acetyltransferase
MLDIGSIGYAVKVSEWNKGYGTQILRRGLEIAREYGMGKVLLNINEKNAASSHLCEKMGGKLWDTIERYNEAERDHFVRRYWIML